MGVAGGWLKVASPRGVVDEARYKVFRDDGYPGRLKIIGPDSGNRVLTIMVDRPKMVLLPHRYWLAVR